MKTAFQHMTQTQNEMFKLRRTNKRFKKSDDAFFKTCMSPNLAFSHAIMIHFHTKRFALNFISKSTVLRSRKLGCQFIKGYFPTPLSILSSIPVNSLEPIFSLQWRGV